MIKMILEISILLLLGNETRHNLDAGGRRLKVQIGEIKPTFQLSLDYYLLDLLLASLIFRIMSQDFRC